MGLHQVLAIFWARKWIILLAGISMIPVAIVVADFLPSLYTAEATLMHNVAEPDLITGESMSMPLRDYRETQISLVTSERIALQVVRHLRLTNDSEFRQAFEEETDGRGDLGLWIAHQLQDNVDAAFLGISNIMVIQYTAASPDKAASIANAYMSVFINEQLEMQIAPARRSADWYTSQIEELRSEFMAARQELAAFSRENGMLLNQQVDIRRDEAELVALSDELVRLQSELFLARSVLESYADAGDVPPDLATNPDNETPALARLRGELAAVDTEVASLMSRVGPNNPQVIALNSTRDTLIRQIRQEEDAARRRTAAQVQVLEDQVASVQGQIAQKRREMLELQELRDTLNGLLDEVEFRQRRLDMAEERAASLQMRAQQSFVNIVPLDAALPPLGPTFPPPKLLIIAAAVCGGLGLGVVLSAGLELLDRRVRTLADLEQATDIEPLGILMPAASSRRGRRRMGMPSLPVYATSGAGR